VVDKRSGHTWTQRPLEAAAAPTVRRAALAGGCLAVDVDGAGPASGVELRAWLNGDEPELIVTLLGRGAMSAPVALPHPFIPGAGAWLIVPMNEGIAYPVEDDAVEPRRLIAYGGHGICMGWWGVVEGDAAQMAIIEDRAPLSATGLMTEADLGNTRGTDDAAIRIARAEGRLCIAPEWEPQKGQFGYMRALRFIFMHKQGHVAMARRYRRYAQEHGRLRTLAEKREAIPAVDRLIGAANIWCWEKPPVPIADALIAQGMERLLWSEANDAADIAALNARGLLTSSYDMVQDVMDPARYPEIRFIHRRWPSAAWPQDLMRGPTGDWTKGWEIERKEGGLKIPCGVVCDRQAPPYALRRISQELETLPYNCRFIDTTTATPWRECYDARHPMTRSDSRAWKMELLRVINQFGLVTGTETGHDASVPYVHYFEGMLSLGPYRVPDAGRAMRQIWDEVPERVAKYQLGEGYRLPLWELVFHDCVVAHWYWGDYNNKLPALWNKRDLFNILYGTAPMYMLDAALWEKEAPRFAASYARIAPVARALGYAEMTDHLILTEDRAVQQTVWSTGARVTVNFGGAPFALEDGAVIGANSYQVEGL
jgi:hypothetical protein